MLFLPPFFGNDGMEKRKKRKKKKAINTPVKFDICDERDAPRVKSIEYQTSGEKRHLKKHTTTV